MRLLLVWKKNIEDFVDTVDGSEIPFPTTQQWDICHINSLNHQIMGYLPPNNGIFATYLPVDETLQIMGYLPYQLGHRLRSTIIYLATACNVDAVISGLSKNETCRRGDGGILPLGHRNFQWTWGPRFWKDQGWWFTMADSISRVWIWRLGVRRDVEGDNDEIDKDNTSIQSHFMILSGVSTYSLLLKNLTPFNCFMQRKIWAEHKRPWRNFQKHKSNSPFQHTQCLLTVDGRNPAPPGMYKTFRIMG